MKRVLILHLLFVVCLFSYGQMTLTSSSLNDTKWRNENTGDWDIGFFENFAVYDCKF